MNHPEQKQAQTKPEENQEMQGKKGTMLHAIVPDRLCKAFLWSIAQRSIGRNYVLIAFGIKN